MDNMQVNADQYEVKDNGPGCECQSLDQNGCRKAAAALGYTRVLETGSWSHAPYGCFVGHPYDDWEYVYFNSQNGVIGRDIYKSICLVSTYFYC